MFMCIYGYVYQSYLSVFMFMFMFMLINLNQLNHPYAMSFYILSIITFCLAIS